jgi:hypothetical protein
MDQIVRAPRHDHVDWPVIVSSARFEHARLQPVLNHLSAYGV